jgi:hypothetical protein
MQSEPVGNPGSLYKLLLSLTVLYAGRGRKNAPI